MIPLFEGLSLPVAALGIAACLIYTFHRRPQWIQAAVGLAVLAFALITALLLLRLGKYGTAMPATGGSRYFIGAWFIMLAYFVAAHRYRVPLLGALIMPLALISLLVGVVDDRRVDQAPPLPTVPIWLHLLFMFGALALLLLAAGAALVFLLKTRALKGRDAQLLNDDLPALVILQGLMEKPFDIGFALLTAGTMLGLLVGSLKMPGGWIWEAKILTTLAIGGCYALLFFLRHAHQLSRIQVARGIVLLAVFMLAAFMFTSHRDLLNVYPQPAANLMPLTPGPLDPPTTL